MSSDRGREGRRRMMAAALGLMALSVLQAHASDLKTVVLKDSVTVTGSQVTFGDVAEILPAEQAALLGPVEIAPSPLPGGERKMSRGYIRVRLRRASIDLRGVEFLGPKEVLIRRAGARGQPSARVSPGTSEPAGAPGPEPISVRRGAGVKLVVRRGGLIIETTGKLADSCFVGEIVRVRVAETRATVFALLVDCATAEVIR